MSRRLEVGLLAMLALDPDLAPHMFELIEPEHFDNPGTRQVYAIMHSLNGQGEDLDFLNIMAHTEPHSYARVAMLELAHLLGSIKLDDGDEELLSGWAEEIWG
jgi:replicative DNA helicase